jgi:hypothetical protein
MAVTVTIMPPVPAESLCAASERALSPSQFLVPTVRAG